MTGQIGIIGNGSWGTALAKILTDNGHKIHWWVRNEEAKNNLLARQHNPHYLTSVRFVAGTIFPTNDLAALLEQCDTVIMATPSAYIQELITSIPRATWIKKNIISAIKGVLPECNLLLNDYMVSELALPLQQYVAITGPCHAEEVASERLSYLTFSGLNEPLTKHVAAAFDNQYINTTSNDDIWGVQFAAVLKNVYAIGAGMAHSLDYGDNFLSVYATNCYREMYGFLQQHFEKVHPSNLQPDFHTSAYLGDLLVTCYSLHSRNRTFGAMIGKGYSVKATMLEMNMVAEGYYASRGMQAVSAKYNIDIPMAAVIYQILWEDASPAEGFKKLEKMMT